jgi:hypothetical protein
MAENWKRFLAQVLKSYLSNIYQSLSLCDVYGEVDLWLQ